MVQQQKKFLLELQKLKKLPRRGWVQRNVEYPESVAAHTWGMALLLAHLQPEYAPTVNLAHAIKLALVHDLPEIIAGDISVLDKMDPREKRLKEDAAARELFKDNPEYLALWLEFEERKTPEALFVKAVDTLDVVFMATDYYRSGAITEAQYKKFLEMDRLVLEKTGYSKLWQYFLDEPIKS